MSCEVCGREEEPFPFKCSYCGHYYCSEHRLPENHSCTNLWRARPPSKLPVPPKPHISASSHPHELQGWSPRRTLGFSSDEVKHLAVGTLLVVLVGVSLWMNRLPPPHLLLSAALLFAASFLLHELAHKFAAQRRGLWAEFRVDKFGALLTLISALPFFMFKIIAPGAVVLSGFTSIGEMGRIAVMGPLTNILLALLLLAFTPFTPLGFQTVLFGGVYINILIAFFNLLPLGVLDGRKVMMWSRKVWLVTFALSIMILALVWRSL